MFPSGIGNSPDRWPPSVVVATYGPHAGTKFALDAVGDSLRREPAPLGVGGSEDSHDMRPRFGWI